MNRNLQMYERKEDINTIHRHLRLVWSNLDAASLRPLECDHGDGTDSVVGVVSIIVIFV